MPTYSKQLQIETHLFKTSPHCRGQATLPKRQISLLWFTSSSLSSVIPHSHGTFSFGHTLLCSSASFLRKTTLQRGHVLFISPHWRTCSSALSRLNSCPHPLHLPLLVANKFSTQMFLMFPWIGQRHFPHVVFPLANSTSIQIPQNVWPHGVRSFAGNIGHLLKDKHKRGQLDLRNANKTRLIMNVFLPNSAD